MRFSLFLLSFTLAHAQLVQKPDLRLPVGADKSREQVKQVFVDAFAAYTEFAYGHDDLSPISKSFSDGRNGWGATIVDALATMKIMGLESLFQQSVNFSIQIDFSQSKTIDTVSVFESTIRYVGGLLSAYELNGHKPRGLVDKAQQLVDKLILGYTDKSPINFGFIDFATNTPVLDTSNIAEAGTLTLEWSRLSKYTGNDTYRIITENAVKHIASLLAPLPGLAAQGIDPATGEFVGAYVTWGGGSDSYFEYLLKYARINPEADDIFLRTWRTAVDSSIKYLMKVSTVGNHTYFADFEDDRKIRHIGSHLECFHAGNIILGGKLLRNDTIVDVGLRLADACWNTYASTATGIGPEVFAFTSVVTSQPPGGTDDGSFTGSTPSASDLAFNAENGFYIFDGASDYILRPEVLESNFYAWRVTGDPKYVERAQSALASFVKYLEVPGGHGGVSGINDVNNGVDGGGRIDDTESFFYAEVMKYLFLTFDDPDNISIDKYVFNTEAQPFQAPPIFDFGSTASLDLITAFNPTAGVVAAVLPQISPSLKSPVSVGDVLGISKSGNGGLGRR